jgi:signal transduction histidine kinase
MNSTHYHPLKDGNRLQRAYYRWALPYYERMPPDLREHAEPIDQFLYTRQGFGTWLGWLGGLAGLVFGLHAGLHLPWGLALGLGTVLWGALTLAGLAIWLQPAAFLSRPKARRLIVWWDLIGWIGLSAAFLYWARHGNLDNMTSGLYERLLVVAPGMLIVALSLVVVFRTLARASHHTMQLRLAHAQLRSERDASARSATEAELRLLQAQIQPHFIFNTLATLQHWVDKKDERAGPLLQELTGFLRASTEMLGRSTVPLREELQAVHHYLTILQARFGARLQWQVNCDPGLENREVPPGLLLTLVENAIEHGLEPKIGGGRLSLQAQPLAEGWRLTVLDNGQGLAPGSIENVGLANLRQRLHHHFGASARFTLTPRAEGGAQAEIFFP